MSQRTRPCSLPHARTERKGMRAAPAGRRGKVTSPLPQPSALSPFWASPTSGLGARLGPTARWLLFRLLPFLAMLGALLFLLASPSRGQDLIRVASTNVDNRWPTELAFQIVASSQAADITEIIMEFRVGRGSLLQRGRVEFERGRSVKGEYVLRTRGSNYVPPGADIEYAFVIVDAAGNRLTTSQTRTMYLDPRFTWSSLKSDREPVTAWYYGNGQRAAERSLKAVEEGVQKMGQKAGMAVVAPFKLIIYSSLAHWREAQRTRSETQERELILLGTAHAEFDLVLILADAMLGDPSDTAAHEATHLLVHWAAGGSVPAWLNEGLAVYAQPRIDSGYLSFLETAIRQDRLYALRGLETLPGRPDENIAGYGQAYSVVKFLIESYGPQKMSELLAGLKAGQSVDEALRGVYGFDRDGLDAKWRESVGARPRQYDFTLPTPIAMPTLAPLTLPQSSGGPARGSQAGEVPASNPAAAFTLLGLGLVVVSLLAAVGFTAARWFRRGS